MAEFEKRDWMVEDPVVKRLLVKKLVEVAEDVMSRLEMVVEARVDDAVEMIPLVKRRVVEVAFSPVDRVVKLKGAVGHVVLQVSPVRQRVVTAKVVEVALVVVELVAVKDWRVDDPLRVRLVAVPVVKLMEEKSPVALFSTGEVKVWLLVMFWTMTERLVASASLCLVTVGLSSVALKFRA